MGASQNKTSCFTNLLFSTEFTSVRDAHHRPRLLSLFPFVCLSVEHKQRYCESAVNTQSELSAGQFTADNFNSVLTSPPFCSHSRCQHRLRQNANLVPHEDRNASAHRSEQRILIRSYIRFLLPEGCVQMTLHLCHIFSVSARRGSRRWL